LAVPHASLDILLALHHRLKPGFGAPGTTLQIGQTLSRLGCHVEYYSYDDAFPNRTDSVTTAIRFPWKLASFLGRHSKAFDVVDVSTGDAWVWSLLGRPGPSSKAALITRSHGLEQMVDRWEREHAEAGKQKLSWTYPLYHGGYRLWEVRRSLRAADHCILLTDDERKVAANDLGIANERISVIGHGLVDRFIGLPEPAPFTGALRLAFVGTWIERKGIRAIADAALRMTTSGLDFGLSILGSRFDAEHVMQSFDPRVRPRISVTPKYRNEELPALLSDSEILLFPSLAEGYGTALPEGMACGLAPVATPFGAATTVIQDGCNGTLIPPDDGAALARGIADLAADRRRLLQIRSRAQSDVQGQRWEGIARQRLQAYERGLASRLGSRRKEIVVQEALSDRA
jgi:glycosyltransferase involved in cell wall biosynthesis